MPGSGSVQVLVWNSNGDLSATVADFKPAGVQVTRIPISNFAVGVYLYKVVFNFDSGATQRSELQKFSVIR
jgi:hypothetical protein